jgi:hypothetical protein
MSEPIQPQPVPEPFAPAPVQPRAGGCSKPALIGCGVVFLLLGIVGLVVVMKARDLLVWSLDRTRTAILGNLADDVTAADRERFDAAYAAAITRIRDNKMDPTALQSLQTQLLSSASNPGQKVTRERFLAMTAALEKMGGIEPPAEGEPAAPPAHGQGTAQHFRARALLAA